MAANLSFLPEDYIQKRIETRTNLICLTLFGLLLIGVVGAFAVTNNQKRQVVSQLNTINAQCAEATKRIEQLNDLQQRKTAMLRKARISALLVEPIQRSVLWAELTNRMPASLGMLELNLASKKVTPPVIVIVDPGQSALANGQAARKQPEEPPVPTYEVGVSMIGVAPTDVQVAQYMASLGRCPLLAEVNLLYSEETKIEDIPMRKFRIDMSLNNNADMNQYTPLMAQRKAANPALQLASPNPLENQ